MASVSFDSHEYFQRYTSDKITIAKIGKGNNSIMICDRATILVFTSSLLHPLYSPFSVASVSFDSHEYFQRYTSDKITIAKIGKGNNSIMICDRATILVFTSYLPHLYCIFFHIVSFNTSRNVLRTSFYSKLYIGK